jgi:alpha-D-xyloside xylohydrolase
MHGDRLPYEPVRAADGTERLRSGAPNELWSYGDDVYRILVRYVRLREALRPYLRTVMRAAHTDGQPVMRGLFHEFPDDTASWDVTGQYMLGPDLLVAPVVSPHATSRSVYLPAGARWTHLLTGEVHDGGQTIDTPAPIDQIPVFARDGALADLVGRVQVR